MPNTGTGKIGASVVLTVGWAADARERRVLDVGLAVDDGHRAARQSVTVTVTW